MSDPIQTPRTSAAAQQALSLLTQCRNEQDYRVAIKAVVTDLLALAKALETENVKLRQPH